MLSSITVIHPRTAGKVSYAEISSSDLQGVSLVKPPLLMLQKPHVGASYLGFFCTCGLQVSVQYFFHNIEKQTSDNYDDYGKPSRATGEQLDKYEVHVLGVQKWPGIVRTSYRKTDE